MGITPWSSSELDSPRLSLILCFIPRLFLKRLDLKKKSLHDLTSFKGNFCVWGVRFFVWLVWGFFCKQENSSAKKIMWFANLDFGIFGFLDYVCNFGYCFFSDRS